VSIPTREDVLECVEAVEVDVGEEFDRPIDYERDVVRALLTDDPRRKWAKAFQETARQREGFRWLS